MGLWPVGSDRSVPVPVQYRQSVTAKCTVHSDTALHSPETPESRLQTAVTAQSVETASNSLLTPADDINRVVDEEVDEEVVAVSGS